MGHEWRSLYPADLAGRARINEVLHWHHGGLRHCSLGYFFPVVHPGLAAAPDVVEASRKLAKSSISLLDSQLGKLGTAFMHGDEPRLSDLVVYGELGQLTPRFMNLYDFSNHAHVTRWMQNMEELPMFDEAHAGLRKFLPAFK